MADTEYYDLLEVSKTASQEEIKRAFRKQAMKYHPDRNPGDKTAEQKFKQINEAYEVLKDEQKRAAYDHYGKAGVFGQGNPFGGGFDFSGGGFADIFNDIFSDFMGGGSARRSGPTSSRRGIDLRYNMNITLEEAFHGTEKEVTIPTVENCEKCHGNGTKNGEKPDICSMCHGSGKVRRQQGGFFVFETDCPMCHGQGYVVKEACPDCHGAGQVKENKKLKIKIKSGVDTNMRIRVAGEGTAGMFGGENGDLYVDIIVERHKLYERRGDDLYAIVPVSVSCAILGGKIAIPGIDGQKVEVEIPAGTQNDALIKVKGEGMHLYDSEKRGDLYVSVRVMIPHKLTAKQRELMEAFQRESEDEKCQPEIKTFFDKIKDLFN
ncbi:MAG: molecular chaperone DnaJ [Alphaproteobacteria bacterium]|nr:molecular chaperone DnaJ [Alphaproteobacteria bacterium]